MQILINNESYQIGQPLPSTIQSTIMMIHPIELSQPIHPNQVPLIKQWFEQIKDKSEFILINGVIVKQEGKLL